MSDEQKSEMKRGVWPSDLTAAITPAPAPAPALDLKTVEQWCAEKGTPDWLYEGARVGNRWPVGQEMNEAKYDAAIDAAGKVEIR